MKLNPSSRSLAIPPNITREERKAIRELKEDKSRMVLTADKGVSLVVMDTADYKKKAEELLQQPTYQPIPTDPTSKYKNKLINMLKSIKAEGVSVRLFTRGCTQLEQDPPNFMACPRYIKNGCHLDLLYLVLG